MEKTSSGSQVKTSSAEILKFCPFSTSYVEFCSISFHHLNCATRAIIQPAFWGRLPLYNPMTCQQSMGVPLAQWCPGISAFSIRSISSVMPLACWLCQSGPSGLSSVLIRLGFKFKATKFKATRKFDFGCFKL